jgi:ABC-type antimicrobial peptide transport system permease subunit
MKSYLSLIPISAKIHRQKNRLTLLCIIFAVFLVTTIFSLADMSVRMETTRLFAKHSNLTLQNILNNPAVQNFFLPAIVLFVIVLIAGVLMISSSINSNVAQRTKFFGQMRCLGMTRRQIIRFVRLEALNWCKTAIPAGIGLGIVTTWMLCACLRFMVGEEFSSIPVFGISAIGIISGFLVGIITVLLAASSPARHAARISPVTAVSGNFRKSGKVKHLFHIRFLKIETALGINHAMSSKKNLFLMTGSFALSIILFLSFTVIIEFVNHIMPQLSNTSDINISSRDNSNTIDNALPAMLKNMDGVKRVFGSRDILNIPVKIGKDGSRSKTIDLISYDSFDLDCLKKDKLLKKGSNFSEVYGDNGYVLVIQGKNDRLEKGDTIQIADRKLIIAGALKCNPFSSDGSADKKITLITSSDTFTRLTGITGYSLVQIQTTKKASNENVAAIKRALKGKYTFSDLRDQRTTNTHLAFIFFVYAFLAIIILVTVLNIINSISLSVSARTKQYGAMRAVGMDGRQITKMIATEAFSYAIFGCIIGSILGLWISRILYKCLITNHFSYATWSIPIIPLSIILFFILAAAVAATYAPAKRIRNMVVTDTIKEL